MGVCSILPVGSISRNFMAEVHIPVGFVLEDIAAYKTYLTIDQSTMNIFITNELRPSTVVVEPATLDTPALEMACESKVNVIRAKGSLYYNAIIAGFKPANLLSIPDVTIQPTAFSGAETIPVDDIIAYSCFECTLPDNIINGFEILVEEGQQFLIDEKGNNIVYNPTTPDDFIEALSNPNNSQTIFLPYTITLTPVII